MIRYLITILLFNIAISNMAYSSYSEVYDETLDNLTIVNPKKSLSIAKKNLLDSELNLDKNKQLVSIYYIVQSLSILSKHKLVDDYINKGFLLAEQTNSTRFKSEFIGMRAYQEELKGNYKAAILDANKALQYANEIDDDRLLAETLAVRGQVQLAIESYDLALKDIEKALAIFKKNKDNINTSITYNSLAIAHLYLDDNENALKYYQESIDYDDIKSPYNQAVVFYNMGGVYVSNKDYDKAISYYEKSMKLSKINNDQETITFINYGMAEVYLLQKKFGKAKNILSPVLKEFELSGDLLMFFNANLLMAEIQIAKKQYDKSLVLLNLSESLAKTLNTPSANLYYLLQKAEYFEATQQWQEAFELTKKIRVIRKKLQKEDKEKLTSELKIRFGAQFDQEKLDFLQNKTQLQKAIIEQEKTTKTYLWSLIFLSLFVLIYTYLAYKNQRKIKRHLYKLSFTDYLTNTANRRHIMERLKHLHMQNIDDQAAFGLVMIDLDYFKKINDTYGHDVGNEVLIYFAHMAKSVMVNIGEVGRIGGEEWLILLPNINNTDTIKDKLSELRESYKNIINKKIPDNCKLSFSSGVVICDGQYDSHEKMLFEVDAAMYQAKQKGREQDVFV